MFLNVYNFSSPLMNVYKVAIVAIRYLSQLLSFLRRCHISFEVTRKRREGIRLYIY